MKFLMIIAVGLALTACTGINEAMTKYTGTEPITYDIVGNKWRIYDQPENGRLMITPGYGKSTSTGFKQGITYGLAGNPYKEADAFQPAATAYLAQRNCKISGGHLVLPYQYEFEYVC